jgi:hypothetical protein
MATDNKIVWFGLGAVAAVFLLRYYNKNKGLMVQDIQSDASKVLKSAQDNLNAPRTKRNGVLEIRDIKNAPKAEVKEPINVPVRNLIPNVYDNNIGDDVFANMTGGTFAPTSMQGACKCSDTTPKRYKTLHLNPYLS